MVLSRGTSSRMRFLVIRNRRLRLRNGNATTTYRIRVVPLEGNPWFVAGDVCRALGLTLTGGATRHLTNLSRDEVRRMRVSGGPQGGRPNAIISDSGLYKLIMRSDKPQARVFQEWVMREVLATIRKTGGYVLQGADRATLGAGTVSEMPDVGGWLTGPV